MSLEVLQTTLRFQNNISGISISLILKHFFTTKLALFYFVVCSEISACVYVGHGLTVN